MDTKTRKQYPNTSAINQYSYNQYNDMAESANTNGTNIMPAKHDPILAAAKSLYGDGIPRVPRSWTLEGITVFTPEQREKIADFANTYGATAINNIIAVLASIKGGNFAAKAGAGRIGQTLTASAFAGSGYSTTDAVMKTVLNKVAGKEKYVVTPEGIREKFTEGMVTDLVGTAVGNAANLGTKLIANTKVAKEASEIIYNSKLGQFLINGLGRTAAWSLINTAIRKGGASKAAEIIVNKAKYLESDNTVDNVTEGE